MRRLLFAALAVCLFATQALAILPGMMPGVVGFAVCSSLTFVASAGSTGSTIVIPAGAKAGDLGVLFDKASHTSLPSSVVPTNWTQAATSNNGINNRAISSFKILTEADPGATITGMNGNVANNKVMAVFRCNAPIATATPNTWSAETTSGDPSGQSVTASGGTPPLVVIGHAGQEGSTVAFSTASPAFDGTALNSNSDVIVGYKIYDTSPSNHSIDMNDHGGANSLHSGYIAVE